MGRHYCVYNYAYLTVIYSAKIIFILSPFFTSLGEKAGCGSLNINIFTLRYFFFTTFYVQYSLVSSLFLLKDFPFDPASSEE